MKKKPDFKTWAAKILRPLLLTLAMSSGDKKQRCKKVKSKR